MNFGIQKIPIKALMHKQWLDTEMRCNVNYVKVEQYAAEKTEGDKFPEPIVFLDKKQQYWVGDGFHRILADKENGEKTSTVNLQKGTKLDAILKCIEINREQLGLPFTRGDKQRAIKVLLENETTRVWSQTRIAETIGCSSAYVSFVIEKEGTERPAYVQNRDGVLTPSTRVRQSSEDQIERRKEVAALLLAGRSRSEIADETGVSIHTIGNDIAVLKATNAVHVCTACGGSGYVQTIKSRTNTG